MRFEDFLTPAERLAYATINELPPIEAVRLDSELDKAAQSRGWMQPVESGVSDAARLIHG